MPSARFTTTAHTAVATTDKIPALKSTTKGHLTPPFFWPPGHLYGLTLANGTDATNDINIAAGSCMDSTNVVPMSLSALVKQLDADWVAGTNQGMRNSGAAITDTTYHIYAVCKAGGADPDIYAHTSATVATVITALQAETGGSAYLYARRIGSIMRASSAIVAFIQNGDEFTRSVPVLDVNDGDPGLSAVTRTLSVPIGIVVQACITVGLFDLSPGTNTHQLVTSLAQADTAAGAGAYTQETLAGTDDAEDTNQMRVFTNTSGQIRSRVGTNSDADTYTQIVTHGWVDTRGRLA